MSPGAGRTALNGRRTRRGRSDLALSMTAILSRSRSAALSLNRAMRSFGWYAILGEATTLLTAMVMLPAMLLLARRRAAVPA